MRKLILFCFLMAAASLAAYDFPAPGGKVTSSFGSKGKGQFNTGIEIETENVFASEEGEVLYYGDDFVAVAHEDSILTLYSQIAVSEGLGKDIHIKKGQLLGQTKRGVLHFAVYDLDMEQYINPLLMTEAVKKSELPKVKRISYVAEGGLLSVYLEDKGFTGLYRVQVSLGGEVVRTLGFSTIQRRDNVLVLDREAFEYETLYGKNGALTFPGIRLNPGNNVIEIIITDFYGKKVVFHDRITL